MSSKKLAIILSHPVQYYSPLFAAAAKEMEIKVFYGFQPNSEQQGRQGFGKAFQWDIDLLEGYSYEFVANIAAKPSSASYSGCDTPSLGVRLKEYGATHIVTFGWHLKMYRQALQYAKQNKIPIAVRGDSQLNPQLTGWKKIIKKLYYPYFLNKYDIFLSVGKRNKEYLKYYGISEQKIIFSPHAIDQTFWKVQRKKENPSFVFVWVGKFISLKRPLDVIQAFKKMLAQDANLKEEVLLQMVGSGELLEVAKQEARDCKQIQFLGFKNQTELRAVYEGVDCLILSSESETWGLVVNEAFAAGIPAVVSEACGCVYDLINENSGLSYKTGKIVDLEEAMLRIYDKLSDPFEKTKMQQSIKMKNEVYSFNKVVESFQIFLKNY